jgi:predicted transcriptional regulator
LTALAGEVRPKSFLENLFEYLDLPGATIRNIFAGRPLQSLQSIGAFAMPGLISRPEDQPDFGFVGNLLLDPLMYLSGGATAGAKTGVMTALKLGQKGFGRANTVRAITGVLRSEATRAGRKALRGKGMSWIDNWMRPLTGPGRGPAVRIIEPGAKFAGKRRAGQEILRGAARQEQAHLLRQARQIVQQSGLYEGSIKGALKTPELIEQMTKQGLLKSGGLRAGLPFMEGRTIAFADKNINLLQATPFYWIGRGVSKFGMEHSKAVRGAVEYTDNLIRKVYPGFRMTQAGRMTQAAAHAQMRRMMADADDTLGALFKNFDHEARQDFSQILADKDLRGSGVIDLATFKKKHPKLSKVTFDEQTMDIEDLLKMAREDRVPIVRARVDELKRGILAEGYDLEHLREADEMIRVAYRNGVPVVRDGKHRIQALSELGHKQVKVVFEHSDIDDAVAGWKKMMDDVKRELQERGIWMKDTDPRYIEKYQRLFERRLRKEYPELAEELKGINKRRKDAGLPAQTFQEAFPEVGLPPRLYFPQQYTDEIVAEVEKFNFKQRMFENQIGVEGVGKSATPKRVSTRSPYHGTREFYEQEEFIDYIGRLIGRAKGRPKKYYQELDIVELARKRMQAHARAVSNDDLVKNAKRLFGQEARVQGGLTRKQARDAAAALNRTSPVEGLYVARRARYRGKDPDITPIGGRYGPDDQEILDLITEGETVTVKAVAASTGFSVHKVRRTLNRFVKSGHLRKSRRGRVDQFEGVERALKAGEGKIPPEVVGGLKKVKYEVIQRRHMDMVDQAFSEWMKSGAGQMRPRGGMMAALDWWNKKLFKPFVTIGVGPVPNPAFHIRNILSGIWQAASDPQIGLASGLRHTAQIFYDGVASAVERIPGFKNVLPRTQMTKIIQASKGIDVKLTGQIVKGTNMTDTQIADALRRLNVTRHGFARMEDLVKAVQDANVGRGVGKTIKDTFLGHKFPALIAEAIEDRMRAQGFVAALKKGLTGDQAADATRRAFIDYEFVSTFHRNIRDFVPFAQFTIGQTPRTLATAMRNPRVMAPLYTAQAGVDTSGPVPPWISEQPHFRAGEDEEGNPLYVAGLGTPFEDINKFWAGTIGRTLEKGMGSTTAPLRFMYEQAARKEPYFGTELGKYKRETPATSIVPSVIAGRRTREITTAEGKKETISEVSPRLHRLLRYLPWTRQISMMNQLFDTRHKVWAKSVNILTGAKIRSVNEDKELRQMIGKYLKDQAESGNIGAFQKFFAYGDVDPELAGVIKAYYASKGK